MTGASDTHTLHLLRTLYQLSDPWIAIVLELTDELLRDVARGPSFIFSSNTYKNASTQHFPGLFRHLPAIFVENLGE